MRIDFAEGYDLLPISYGYPYAVHFDGIRLRVDFREETDDEKRKPRWFSLLCRPIWFSSSHTSYELGSTVHLDNDPVDHLGLYGAVELAQLKGFEPKAFRFKHYDVRVRIITFDDPVVKEIAKDDRLPKVKIN